MAYNPAIVPEVPRIYNSMLSTTQNAIRAILGADPTITNEEKQAWGRMIARGNPLAEVSAVAAEPLPRLVSAAEVVKLTGLTVQSVRRYARRGILRRVIGAGMQRGRGYTEASVRALLEGRPQGVPVAPCGGVADGAGAVA